MLDSIYYEHLTFCGWNKVSAHMEKTPALLSTTIQYQTSIEISEKVRGKGDIFDALLPHLKVPDMNSLETDYESSIHTHWWQWRGSICIKMFTTNDPNLTGYEHNLIVNNTSPQRLALISSKFSSCVVRQVRALSWSCPAHFFMHSCCSIRGSCLDSPWGGFSIGR
jgi:hypothetical protein